MGNADITLLLRTGFSQYIFADFSLNTFIVAGADRVLLRRTGCLAIFSNGSVMHARL